MAVDPQSLPYRPCVGIMLLDAQGRVFVGRRADQAEEGRGNWWQMPQGGIDKGESAEAAAFRELYEETGVRSAELIQQASKDYCYELPPHLVGVAWKGRYRGQRQSWFAMRFLGRDSEIVIGPHDGHKAEFDAWRWVAMSELIELIVPFKRAVYAEVVAEFGHLGNVPALGPKG
ncbi:MAG: RNA pyrophosphohydrolase [Hyphomicrobiaceae bacterium]